MPNATGSQNQYQPHPDSAAVFPAPEAAVYAQQPSSSTVFNAPGHNSNPHAFVNQPGAPLYAQAGTANNNPYTSAGMVVAPAYANQGASRAPVAGVPNRSRPALLNSRANELLRAVQRARTPDFVEGIINGVIWDQDNGVRVPLMELAETRDGETALVELVRATLRHRASGALQRLFRCLIDGWIMEQRTGPEMLQHFFTTLDYVHCSIFIDELAIPRFWEMVMSRSLHARMSMMVCLDNTGYYTDQGTDLHVTFVYHSVAIARNIYGFLLLRTIFETGRNNHLKERIRQRVMANLMELSMHQYGNNVVLACFIPSNRPPLFSAILLQCGLQAFSRLHGVQLAQLVQNNNARHVLHRLLQTSMTQNAAAAEAMRLAEQILGVGQGWWTRGDPRAQAIAILRR
ncbi:uncharacterized protein LOC110431905 [Sorghum bicolor]|nr:uncharacterized protein LOC110431905 [Sorghum bicolor]|eukprot:XP_021307371.1 uncharacterized protein LOC110431905 [Sorghum bicolor]